VSNYLVVKDKVQRYAKEVFDQVLLDDDGDLIIPYESTRIFISVSDRGLEADSVALFEEHQLSHTFVEVWAPVIIEVKPSPELYQWVAIEGQDFIYGGCRVIVNEETKNVQVLFRVTLPGDTLDPGELKDALLNVAITADDLDDVLKKRFGGKRIEDV
jgi:hypothetical protein